MRAMILEAPCRPLVLREVPIPAPGPGQLLLRVEAWGVCRTDLHIVDGELPSPKCPLIPGHEIVGTIESRGQAVTGFEAGTRVGVPWLASTCGACAYCQSGRENLCDWAQFTGYDVPGGYAEYAVADVRYCFPLPNMPAIHLAPLLCAGLIGYRSYRLAGSDARRLGLYGFGASAHILAQVAAGQGREVYAFTRSGDADGQRFALDLGCAWAGDSMSLPPVALDAAIIFAPVGDLVPTALRAVRKGGVVVCAGIHMSPIPSFPYRLLWEERMIRSVANLERRDGVEFFDLVGRMKIDTTVTPYSLEQANIALKDVRTGAINGAAVLVIQPSTC